MHGSDILAILAEIFAAFAGFTGIVAVLGQRSKGAWRPVDVIRFRALLGSSLAGLVISLLPFGFYYSAVGEPFTWKSTSLILGFYIFFILFRLLQQQKKLQATKDADFVPWVRLTLVPLGIVVGIVQLLNAIGVGLPNPFSAFLVGLLYLLILCCAMFILLLRFIRTEH